MTSSEIPSAVPYSRLTSDHRLPLRQHLHHASALRYPSSSATSSKIPWHSAILFFDTARDISTELCI